MEIGRIFFTQAKNSKNGTIWAKVEDSVGHVSGGCQKAIEPDKFLEALSFRHTDAHHACILEKQASKHDLALTMSLAESLMYSCVSSA